MRWDEDPRVTEESLRDTETTTSGHLCRYTVYHSNVHLVTALTAQSEISNFPR